MSKVIISVVVPFYKPENRLEQDIVRKWEVCAKNFGNEFELIYVSDGILTENERKNFENREVLEKKYKNLKILGYEKNRGKGFAVRTGINFASGDFIGFIDFESEISESEFVDMFKVAKNFDANVIGVRFAKNVKYEVSFVRNLVSFGFKKVVKILTGLNFSDTQCGMKIFKNSSIKSVLPKLLIDGFSFDVEILKFLVENKEKILEYPVNFFRKKNAKSSIRIFTSIKMMKELFEIRKNFSKFS
ncbi:MAG: glycosyltransferase family 2 protein [Patescibacteria group bacterium]